MLVSPPQRRASRKTERIASRPRFPLEGPSIRLWAATECFDAPTLRRLVLREPPPVRAAFARAKIGHAGARRLDTRGHADWRFPRRINTPQERRHGRKRCDNRREARRQLCRTGRLVLSDRKSTRLNSSHL